MKKSSELLQYQKKLKKYLSEKILDIILFGSVVKGGSSQDIDVALLVKEKEDLSATKEEMRKQFKKEVDIEVLDIESIYTPLWLTLIKEGYSIKKMQYLSEMYHLQPVALYKYSLKKLNAVQKVQFSRGIKKVVGAEGVVLTRSVLLVPLTAKNKMKELLETWGIYYESRDFELLPMVRKETLF